MSKFFRAFGHAWNGIRQAILEQRNLKIHFGVAAAVVAAGLYFQITSVEWLAILLAIGFVIGMELINSALENLADLVTKEYDPLVGKVKDIAAGAVLVVSILAALIGIIIFRPYLLP